MNWWIDVYLLGLVSRTSGVHNIEEAQSMILFHILCEYPASVIETWYWKSICIYILPSSQCCSDSDILMMLRLTDSAPGTASRWCGWARRQVWRATTRQPTISRRNSSSCKWVWWTSELLPFSSPSTHTHSHRVSGISLPRPHITPVYMQAQHQHVVSYKSWLPW